MKYYVAFTEPSFEHIWSYISLIVIVGVLGWYIKSTYLQKKEKNNFMVGLEELGCEMGEAGNSDDPVNSKRDTQGGSTTNAGDTKDTTGNDQDIKYQTSSLRRDFDANGPYTLNKKGTALTSEAYARYLAILNKNVWIKFHITQRTMIE